MYSTVLTAHSLLRWLVIGAGLWAVVTAWRTRADGGPGAPVVPGLLFSMALDVQMLLGLLLYVALSPITMSAMQDLGAAMGNGPWRYWSVEHPALMIAAVIGAHVGRARGGKAVSRRRALVAFGLALLAILVATPWPFVPQGRAWIRW